MNPCCRRSLIELTTAHVHTIIVRPSLNVLQSYVLQQLLIKHQTSPKIDNYNIGNYKEMLMLMHIKIMNITI